MERENQQYNCLNILSQSNTLKSYYKVCVFAISISGYFDNRNGI